MKPVISKALVFGFASLVAVVALPAQAQPADEMSQALGRLTTTIDRLATLMEQSVAIQSEERQTRQVEVAVGILGLRYRKIEQLEEEILRISRQEEEFEGMMTMLNEQRDVIERQSRSEAGQVTDEGREAIRTMETRIQIEEDRIARLQEKKLLLENDLAGEKKRLSHVEAILDTWLDELE